jgi:protein involved in polysaccharide export with SLBB domain
MRITLPVAALALLASACNSPMPMVAASPAAPCNAAAPLRVQVFGGIKLPGTMAFEPGITVFAAIQHAGGLADGARRGELRILRCGHPIGPFPAPAAPGAVTDLPLERGDVVDVPVDLY